MSCYRQVRDRAAALAKRIVSPPRPLVKLGLVLSGLWGGSVADAAAHTQGAYLLSRMDQQQPPPCGYTLEQAVAKVRSEVPGRILSTETVVRETKVIYRIKVLTRDGRVMLIEIDAATGKRAH